MTQSVDDLKSRVHSINQIFATILDHHWNLLGAEKQQQLITGINKAYGQAKSFEHEYLITLQAQNKGRPIITQTHADVTVGAADALFAKSIEAKSVTAATKGEANTLIRKALEQLGGATGHLPRDKDVRILDIKIDGVNNPWPLPGGGYGTHRGWGTLANIESEAERELVDMVDNTALSATGTRALRAWLDAEDHGGANFQGIYELKSHVVQTPSWDPSIAPVTIQQFPNSTRKLVQTTTGLKNLRCLTIKIRYETGYLLRDLSNDNVTTVLSQMVFQVYKRPGGTRTIELVKKKLIQFDETGIAAPVLIRV